MSLDELEKLATTAAINTGPDGDWYCPDLIASSRPVSSPRWAREFTAAASPATVLRLVAIARAAQAVVDRWDTPLWKDVPHTGEFIAALRKALGEAGNV